MTLCLQVLALVNLISAAVCQGSVDNSLLRGAGVVPDTETFDTAAWIIFLSFWVMIYQTLAVVQLFIKADVLYITIPFIDWSIFFLIVNECMIYIHWIQPLRLAYA